MFGFWRNSRGHGNAAGDGQVLKVQVLKVQVLQVQVLKVQVLKMCLFTGEKRTRSRRSGIPRYSSLTFDASLLSALVSSSGVPTEPLRPPSQSSFPGLEQHQNTSVSVLGREAEKEKKNTRAEQKVQ